MDRVSPRESEIQCFKENKLIFMRKLIAASWLFTVIILQIGNKAMANRLIDTIGIRITLDSKNPPRNDKLNIRYEITNHSKQVIRVPTFFFFGVGNDLNADVILEVEKRSNNVFNSFSLKEDYFPIYEEIKLEDLKEGDEKNDYFDVAFFYSRDFPAGSYRIRFLFKASKYNKMKNIYSNWLEFEIGGPS